MGMATPPGPGSGRQVNMAYIGGATHVLHGSPQWAATAKAGAIPNADPGSDCALQLARMRVKPLVIAHQDDAVKLTQALHTPPITLGKCGGRQGRKPSGGGPGPPAARG